MLALKSSIRRAKAIGEDPAQLPVSWVVEEEILDVLEAMEAIENYTTNYLVQSILSCYREEPQVIEFLVGWAYEELHHAAAIRKYLEENGRISFAPQKRIGSTVSKMALLVLQVFRVSPVGLHMILGAINEWTARESYLLLSNKTKNPSLAALLRDIARQESRHADFYEGLAAERLAGSWTSRKLARYVAKNHWRPVGTRLSGLNRSNDVLKFLYDSEDGFERAREVDRKMAKMPGLDDTAIFSSYLLEEVPGFIGPKARP
jgi:tRNA isopentenyl-2-thiomethyl-A-37 hydroxylase MiaE